MTLITGEVYGFSHLKQLRILTRTTFLVRLDQTLTQYTHVVVYYNTITNLT